LTDTFDPHELNPSLTLTVPLALSPFSVMETRRACLSEASVMTKFEELDAEPLGPTTVIGPVIAPPGTVAVIWVGESTLNVPAGVPPNLTPVAPSSRLYY